MKKRGKKDQGEGKGEGRRVEKGTEKEKKDLEEKKIGGKDKWKTKAGKRTEEGRRVDGKGGERKRREEKRLVRDCGKRDNPVSFCPICH